MYESTMLYSPNVTEAEIRTYIKENNLVKLSETIDRLAFCDHMWFDEILDLFERLGGDRKEIQKSLFGRD